MFRRILIVLVLFSLGIWLAGCGPAGQTRSAPGKGATKTSEPSPETKPGAGKTAVKIVGFAFDPAEVTLKAGTTVAWTNEDEAPHVVHADGGEFKSGSLSREDSFEQAFDGPGTVTYHCHVHPDMKAKIIVE